MASRLNVKTRSAATAARREGVVDDLELAANQLHRVVHLAALQELQARQVQDDLGARGGGRGLGVFRGEGKDGVVLAERGPGRLTRCCGRRHHVFGYLL